MDPAPITHLFLVTGTTRGLGKALVASASDHPNSFVVSLARSAPFLESKRQNIRIDLNDADAIGPAFASIRLDPQRISRLIHTVLINNAGVLDPIAPIGDCDDTLLARNIQVNLTAPLILSRHFFHFRKSLPGRKWIVNITSGASRSPYYGWSAYGAAKAGLDMATRAMAMEFTRIDPAFERLCRGAGNRGHRHAGEDSCLFHPTVRKGGKVPRLESERRTSIPPSTCGIDPDPAIDGRPVYQRRKDTT
jgi:NADP-dependent 3-hydroxy acid dehydrogenase YdfG